MKSLFSGLLVFVFCILPSGALAALVPCGPGIGVDCTPCHLFELLRRVLQFGFELAFIFTGLVILWGGFLIMTSTGSTSRWQQGKKTIINILVALVILLVAWMGVDTVIRILVGSETITPQWGPWNKLPC